MTIKSKLPEPISGCFKRFVPHADEVVIVDPPDTRPKVKRWLDGEWEAWDRYDWGIDVFGSSYEEVMDKYNKAFLVRTPMGQPDNRPEEPEDVFPRYDTERERADDRYDWAVAKERARHKLFVALFNHVVDQRPHVIRNPAGPSHLHCVHCCAHLPILHAIPDPRTLQHEPNCLYNRALTYQEQYGNPI